MELYHQDSEVFGAAWRNRPMANDPFAASSSFPRAEMAGRASPVRSALIEGLERIRERFHRHLDAIEALAREQIPPGMQDVLRLEDELRHKAGELESAQLQMQSRIDRWERERQEMIEKIEHDRRLLAEAWERLEREQIKNVAATPVRDPVRETSAPAAQAAPAPMRSSVDSDHDQPVAEEILRQFQSLRRDVRRTAETSCGV
jgi:hypothetical protein